MPSTTDRWTLMCGAAAYCFGYGAVWVQPVMIGDLVQRLHFDEIGAGLVASLELVTLAATSMMLSRVIRSASLRTLAVVGAVLAITASIFSSFATHAHELLLSRFCAGVGEGTVYFTSSLALGRLSQPDRAYGIVNIVSILFGMAMLTAMPLFQSLPFPTATYPLMTAAAGLLLPLLLLMPRVLRVQAPQERRRVSSTSERHREKAALIVAAVFMPAGGCMMWAFYGVVAQRAGLGAGEIARALSWSILAALLTAIVQPLIGVRIGRLVPYSIGLAAMTAADCMAFGVADPVVVLCAPALGMAGIYLALPYTYGAAAQADASGQTLSLVAGVLLLISAVGPFAAGLLVEHLGMTAAAIAAVLAAIPAWFAFQRALRAL